MLPSSLDTGRAVDSVCGRTIEQLEAISMYTEFQDLVMGDTIEGQETRIVLLGGRNS
jgi:hypothetical protein